MLIVVIITPMMTLVPRDHSEVTTYDKVYRPMTLVPLYRGGTQPVKTGMKQEARTTWQSF